MTPQLAAYCEQQLTRVRDSGALAVFDASAPELRDALPRVLAGSDFVCDASRATPTRIWLVDGAALSRPLAPGEMAATPGGRVLAEPDLAGFMAALRRQREREMVRIAWRDLAGWATLNETLADTSAFADAAIEAAVEYASQDLVRTYGEPRNTAGERQAFIVLGMGKLGGGELNFSSDIDLIFLFPDKGTTAGARCIDNEDYFTRLGRLVIRLLGERTAEGSVFRVDMRLRPFGDSGPLTASATFLDDYLQTHGRDWERYAWIKARAVTGSGGLQVDPGRERAAVRLPALPRFRRVRSAARDEGADRKGGRAPRSRRTRQARARRHPRDRIRRAGVPAHPRRPGPAHADTVVAGGACRSSPAASCCPRASRRNSRRPMFSCAGWRTACRCSPTRRRTPFPPDALTRERIALAMGFADWEGCGAELDLHRARVTRAFQEVMFARNEAAPAEMPGVNGIVDAWVRGAEGSQLAAGARGARLSRSATQAAALLTEFRGGGTLRRLDAPGRARLDTLMPRLLAAIADAACGVSQVDVLRRILRVLEAIGSRSAYFALLNENAQVRRKLVELAARGEFLAAQIASHPLLLDELLDEAPAGGPRRAPSSRPK